MEISSKFKERESHYHSPLNSPASHGSSTTTTTTTTTSSCSNNNNNNPIPITRSDPNSPYPTTFVTADTSSFKHVVQMLTGSPSSDPFNNPKNPKQPDPKTNNYVIPPIKTTTPKKQGFKLYERRNSLKNMISPLTPSFAAHQHASFSPRNNNFHNNHYHNNHMPEILSPSLLDFPSLTLSPVTPLVEDLFNKSPSINNNHYNNNSSSASSSSEEEKAIAEKGFYLHPSPRENPQLLPLFPLSSPRMSGP